MGQFADRAVKTAEAAKPGKPCVVARGFVALGFDDDDFDEYERLVHARNWQTIELTFPAGFHSLRRHAMGQCMCPEGTRGKGVMQVG